MLLVDAPVFFPSTCVCGEAHGRMADTGVERYEERFYLCERCVRDAGRLFGMVDQADIDAATAKADEAAQKVEALELEVADLRPVRDMIESARDRWGDVEADDQPVRQRARKAA